MVALILFVGTFLVVAVVLIIKASTRRDTDADTDLDFVQVDPPLAQPRARPKRQHVPARSGRARGLILSAARTSTPTKLYGKVVECRQVKMEIEFPGEAPYVVSTILNIPLGLVEARPGDTLELSINGLDLTVLGPGGFTGPWLRPVGANSNVGGRR